MLFRGSSMLIVLSFLYVLPSTSDEGSRNTKAFVILCQTLTRDFSLYCANRAFASFVRGSFDFLAGR